MNESQKIVIINYDSDEMQSPAGIVLLIHIFVR